MTAASGSALPQMTLLQRARDALQKSRQRDPRAAPTSIKKNVTIEETCAFYGVADSISKCRMPRSCHDCLAKPGCLITTTGACDNAIREAPYSPYYAFQREYQYSLLPGVANYSDPTKEHNFFAANTTYCPTTDAMCAKCHSDYQWLARSPETVKTLGTQFCVGASGCVCIAICEVPQYRAVQVYDEACGQQKQVYKDPRGRRVPSYSSTRTSSRRDPRGSIASSLEVLETVPESCEVYQGRDARGCGRPRSCHDCLAKKDCLLSGHRCTSMGQYDSQRDFRSYNTQGVNRSENAMFPSSNTTYCATSDEACTRCRGLHETRDKQVKDTVDWNSNSEFCIGDNGCVCVEFCETGDLWSQHILDTECIKIDRTDPPFALGPIAIVALLWAVVWIVYSLNKPSRSRTQRQAGSQQQQPTGHVLRHMLDQAPAAMGLDLFGWRGFHQRLLDKEQELLDGNGDVSPVGQPPVDFDFEFANAPDFDDEEDATAPTVADPHAMASAPSMSHPQRQVSSTRQQRDSMGQLSVMPSAPDFDDGGDDDHHSSNRADGSMATTTNRRSGRHTQAQNFSTLYEPVLYR